MKPTPTADGWITFHDLSDDRLLDFFQVNPSDLKDPPKVLIEQYESQQDYQDHTPSGSIWLHPGDFPELIRVLTLLLEGFRMCKESDSQRSPTPTWGELDGSPGE